MSSTDTTTRVRRRRHDRRALLTAHDERVLAKSIEAGREAAERIEAGTASPGDEDLVAEAAESRLHFIEANVRLVQSIANKFSVPVHLDRDDIVQDGMIGLEKAVEKFDWRRGYKFSTYATWWIRQSIQRGLEASATTIRIPGHRSRELRAAIAATATGGRLTDELAMIDMLSQLESMDRPLGDGPDTLGTMVPCDNDRPDEAAERNVQGRTDRRTARPPRRDEPIRRRRPIRAPRPRTRDLRGHRRRTRRHATSRAAPGRAGHRQAARSRRTDRRLTRRPVSARRSRRCRAVHSSPTPT